MNSKYKKKASENFDDWCKRLSEQIKVAKLTQEELYGVLHELSVTSFIEGAKAEQETSKKFWSDRENKKAKGYYIDYISDIIANGETRYNRKKYNLFATKKQAKSALAMARISQIMANDVEHFGGVVTDKEWENSDWKYVIFRSNNKIRTTAISYDYYFLAFHTAAQRALFLEKYRDLIKDYLMID